MMPVEIATIGVLVMIAVVTVFAPPPGTRPQEVVSTVIACFAVLPVALLPSINYLIRRIVRRHQKR